MSPRELVQRGIAGVSRGGDLLAGDTIIETGRIHTGSGKVDVNLDYSFTTVENPFRDCTGRGMIETIDVP